MAHGVPTAAELAQALKEFLEQEVMPATDGRLSFMARVAANVAAQLERELLLGERLAAAHADRLATLGVGDDAELCAAIRDGAFDQRFDEVIVALRAGVADKLRISSPRHLHPEDARRADPEGANP